MATTIGIQNLRKLQKNLNLGAKKKKSTFEPDYCAVKLPDNPWIVQPFEIYEELKIEEIIKKHQK